VVAVLEELVEEVVQLAVAVLADLVVVMVVEEVVQLAVV